MHPPYTVAALAFVAVVSGQDPAPAPAAAPANDLLALAARVDAAHRPDGPVPAVTAFTATVELKVIDKNAPEGGDVDLDVAFMAWKPEGRDRELPLIKYEVRGGNAPIARGRDRVGYWQTFQGEAKDLRGAEFEQDLAACKKHTNLARQLVRFLDPAAIMRSLVDPSPVRAEDLSFHPGEGPGPRVRGAKTPCLVVEGRLPSFPLLQQGGDDAPVLLRVFVSKATSRLLAVEAVPIANGKPQLDRMERVHLLELKADSGLLVPRMLEHLFATPAGALQAKSRVHLRLELRPAVRVEDFDRPKK